MAPPLAARIPELGRAAMRARWVPAALFSSGIVAGDTPILVRDFVRSALYDPNHGYFSKRMGPVGMLESSIRFNQLEGRSAYMQHLDKLYKKHDIAWFTPVELFKPWYAYAIAASILRTANLSVPLKIYEIGGGSGTCAKCILDYMMLNAPPKVYNDMKYISVEISSSLAEKQLETVGEVRSHLSKFTVEHRDATNRPGWGRKDPRPCWVLMLEQLMDTLHQALPSMSLIASDFSYLPDVTIAGDRAPLVSSKGDADIFFPTDFQLLEQIDHNCSGFSKEQKNPGAFKPVKKRRTIILDSAAFMEEFGMPMKTKTKDGYNPLLDDFKNTKFYLSVPTHNRK
ncbi:hypothetical protein PR202_gb03981 [Eleusine coracana subsp. coracana]|uniref:Protein arginine methyltransferase NDUFAF7 n=1 Tax=Eleusine coracana subsp. coracana TaxID=191504 RepID=A0AAV5E2M7_ELECO|nr:hypothetical protein PR202_gb03981 [Eleusine coracana subsp. coracana]